MPLVSVVMPVYNGERYLSQSIESILGQTFRDFELIIVDDGSRDGSAAIVRSYAARDERVRLIQLAENGGGANARNQGVAAAEGAYIAAMDCDDVSLPERLEKQVDFLQANPEVGLLGTCARFVDADLRPLYDFPVPRRHALIALYIYFRPRFVHATLMARRDFMLAIGGYTTGRRVGNDLDLQVRMLVDAGVRYANLPGTLLLYRRHEQSTSSVREDSEHKRSQEPRRYLLRHLWGEAPEATLVRFDRMRRGAKFGLREWRLARRDLRRLVDGLIAKNCVDAADEGILRAEANRLLEQTTPRRWQMLLHWIRYRIGRHLQ